MSDETTTPPESREGKQARMHKIRIAGILEELVEAMEAARADGFLTEFSIQQDPANRNYFLPPELPALIKRW
jgi:hypothetical protein